LKAKFTTDAESAKGGKWNGGIVEDWNTGQKNRKRNNGKMEYWNNGCRKENADLFGPRFHYSNVPLFRFLLSIIPLFQYSIIPFFMDSIRWGGRF
jgi:hypothetical protein